MEDHLGEVFPPVASVSLRIALGQLGTDGDIPTVLVWEREHIGCVIHTQVLFLESSNLRRRKEGDADVPLLGYPFLRLEFFPTGPVQESQEAPYLPFQRRFLVRTARMVEDRDAQGSTVLMWTSSSCSAGTSEGDPLMRHWPRWVLGKAMTSRMEST